MRDYTSESPTFSSQISIVESSDPAFSELINLADRQNFENTLRNKQRIDTMEATLEDTIEEVIENFNNTDVKGKIENISAQAYAKFPPKKNRIVEGTDLPYSFQNGCAIEYNNALHILGGDGGNDTARNHYALINGAWKKQADLPYDFVGGCAFVAYYNHQEKLFIVGGNSSSTESQGAYGGYENSFYYLRDNEFFNSSGGYKIPYKMINGCAVVLNNELHILGGTGNNSESTKHYKVKLNGNSYFDLSSNGFQSVSTLPFALECGCALIIDGKIHIFGDANHYSFNGTSWDNEGANYLSINDVTRYNVLYLEKKLYNLVGDAYSLYTFENDVYSDVSWIKNVFAVSYNQDISVIANGNIYLLGGGTNKNKNIIIQKDDWESIYERLNLLDFGHQEDKFRTYTINSEIHAIEFDKVSNGNTYNYFIYDLIMDGSEYSWQLNNIIEIQGNEYEDFAEGSITYVCVINNQVHIITSTYSATKDYLYTSNGVSLSKTFESVYMAFANTDDAIYMFFGGSSYNESIAYDGQNVTSISGFTVPLEMPAICAENGKIHMFGGYGMSGANYNHYVYDIEADEVSVADTMPFSCIYSKAIIMSDGIHILGGKEDVYDDYCFLHYVYKNGQYSSCQQLPVTVDENSIVLFKNEIILIGLSSDEDYNANTDPQRPTYILKDNDVVYGNAVDYNGTIHIEGQTEYGRMYKGTYDGEWHLHEVEYL